MYQFPEEKLTQVIQHIDQSLDELSKSSSSSTQSLAAFDADGTLWANDMGESLLNFQIKENLLPDLPNNPWDHYSQTKAVEPLKAYLWLAQINQGHPIETVREWAEQATKELAPIPTFQAQKEIVEHLHKKSVEVFIVTASVKWAVEPAARFYSIDQDHVIGIQTQIENGIVTDKQKGAITYKSGKVEGLLEHTNGRKPFFCSGNTEGDLPLLESASHGQLVLASAPSDDENHQTEQYMQKLAKDRNWFFHDFLA